MPGVDVGTAQVLVAEIGLDMSRFPSAGHLVSRQACLRGMMKAQAKSGTPASAREDNG